MEKGKYIIVKERGCLVPILFHELISHDSFLEIYCKSNIHSAGFFQIFIVQIHDSITLKVRIYGRSDSLNLECCADDFQIIAKFLEIEEHSMTLSELYKLQETAIKNQQCIITATQKEKQETSTKEILTQILKNQLLIMSPHSSGPAYEQAHKETQELYERIKNEKRQTKKTQN